jgi:hypothetical protein
MRLNQSLTVTSPAVSLLTVSLLTVSVAAVTASSDHCRAPEAAIDAHADCRDSSEWLGRHAFSIAAVHRSICQSVSSKRSRDSIQW